MSHYSVLVIGEDIEGQLEPYNENREVEPYIDGDAASAQATLEQALEYYQERADVKQYVGRTIESFTLEEKLALLEEYDGGEYRVDDGGNLIRYSTYNPNSKWDWYEVGGRWSGYFYVKPGTPQDVFAPSRVHWTEQHQGENSVDKDLIGTTKAPNLTDSALKKYIDFELMRKDAEIKALQQYEEFEKAVEGTISPGAWKDFARGIVGDLWDRDSLADLTPEQRAAFDDRINEARRLFATYPFVEAARKLNIWGDAHEMFMLDSPDPKKAYVERAINTSTTAFAVVKDGEWYSKGRMGWFGMSTDEVGEDEWDFKVNELIASLPDDTLLSIVDLHI